MTVTVTVAVTEQEHSKSRESHIPKPPTADRAEIWTLRAEPWGILANKVSVHCPLSVFPPTHPDTEHRTTAYLQALPPLPSPDNTNTNGGITAHHSAAHDPHTSRTITRTGFC